MHAKILELGLRCYYLIYKIYNPMGRTQLYEFIFFGLAILLSFNSLRYINVVLLFCYLGYNLCVLGGCIYVGRNPLLTSWMLNLPLILLVCYTFLRELSHTLSFFAYIFI